LAARVFSVGADELCMACPGFMKGLNHLKR